MLDLDLDGIAQRHPSLAADTARLSVLLSDAPASDEAVALVCELTFASAEMPLVEGFLAQYAELIDRFSPVAKLDLASTLASARLRYLSGPIDPWNRDLARSLLRRCGLSWMNLTAAKVMLQTYSDLNDSRTLLFAYQQVLDLHPDWASDPGMLQIKGHALLQIAKQLRRNQQRVERDSGVPQRPDPEIKEYLRRAKIELNSAMMHGATDEVLQSVKSDLEYIRDWRQPEREQHDGWGI
jgi:hypothetical protein